MFADISRDHEKEQVVPGFQVAFGGFGHDFENAGTPLHFGADLLHARPVRSHPDHGPTGA